MSTLKHIWLKVSYVLTCIKVHFIKDFVLLSLRSNTKYILKIYMVFVVIFIYQTNIVYTSLITYINVILRKKYDRKIIFYIREFAIYFPNQKQLEWFWTVQRIKAFTRIVNLDYIPYYWKYWGGGDHCQKYLFNFPWFHLGAMHMVFNNISACQ